MTDTHRPSLPTRIGYWIEAMRLRTLPVSVAGVVTAWGYALIDSTFKAAPALLCLLFAILAQIASNFANEYYDYKAGLDRPGRVGPRRGVTEGEISPRAMKRATFATLFAACAVGCSLLLFGGLWLIAVGALIFVGVLAYSAGPYPLSRHGWGEVAVIFFFGIIPVTLTYWLQAETWPAEVIAGGVAAGLMGANVLIVNNYRDHDDDRAVGKKTLAVRWGRPTMATIYLFNGFIAVALMTPVWLERMPVASLIVPVAYLVVHVTLYFRICSRSGAALNPLLGMTAMAMAFYCAGFALFGIFA